MRTTGILYIVIGCGMLVQWSLTLLGGGAPEVQTEPARLAFHLAAEFLTAVALIISGAALLLKIHWGRNVALVASGLLLYTVIASPGYFVQQGIWLPVWMFFILLLVTVWIIFKLIGK